jgi:basic amino acid/polyamine antiporter, APA family
MAELKKTLGFWMVAAISFLNLVNTGLFFGVYIGAKHAGIDSLFAWIALAAMSVYIAMCFGELTSMFPSAGGVYEFAKQAYGRFASFLFGWTVWIAGNIATALFTVAALDYVVPNQEYVIGSIVLSPLLAKILLGIAIIIAFNYIAYRGIEASARFMIGLSLFMILTMCIIIYTGFTHLQTANFTGFTFQGSLILLAIFFLSETIFGWESASYMSEETEDAARTIPKALVTTTAFIAVFAVLITIATIGVLGIGAAAQNDKPILAMLIQTQAPTVLLVIVNIGIVAALFGNVSGNIIGLPRLLLAMSRDKLFIEQFSDVHPTRQTPYKAIIFQCIIAIIIVIIASGAYQKLLELLVPVSLTMYAGILLLVPYFRWKKPDHPRPYKAPFGKVLPVLLVIFFLTLLVLWTLNDPNALYQLRLLFSFIFFSIPIYLVLTYFYDPEQLINTMNFFSRLNLWLEDVLIPTRLRVEAIDFFHNLESKRVLEFGAGVGTLTVHLAERVGRKGKVYAVGLSASDVSILQKRMNKLGHTHVEVIHDPHLISRVHPTVQNVDMIVSIGHLSYIQDVKKVLHEMNALLPQRGNIYFIEYIDLFYFLPNPRWLSDPDEIKKIFAEAGFNVTVKMRRGILWKYLYIYGIKESRNIPYI